MDYSVVYNQDGNTPSHENTDVVNMVEKEQPPADTLDFNVMSADRTPTPIRQDSPRKSFKGAALPKRRLGREIVINNWDL